MTVGPFAKPCDRVLVVNDDADFVETVRDILESSGVTVESAASFAESTRVLERGFLPNVILLDDRLVGGKSEELVAVVRRDPSLSGVRIVLMTIGARQPSALVDQVLPKPFGADELFQALAQPDRA